MSEKEEGSDCAAEIQRLRTALRNVLAHTQRLKKKGELSADNAAHYVRFCKDAGVAPQIVRTASHAVPAEDPIPSYYVGISEDGQIYEGGVPPMLGRANEAATDGDMLVAALLMVPTDELRHFLATYILNGRALHE